MATKKGSSKKSGAKKGGKKGGSKKKAGKGYYGGFGTALRKPAKQA